MAAEQMEVWGLLTENTVTLEHMKFALRFRIEYTYISYIKLSTIKFDFSENATNNSLGT